MIEQSHAQFRKSSRVSNKTHFFFFPSEENRTGLLNISEHLTNATVKVKGFINRTTKGPTVCSFCIIFYIITSVSPKVFPSAEPRCFELWLSYFFFFFFRQQYLRTFPFLPVFVRAVNNEYSQVGENNLEMHKGNGVDRNPDFQIVLMSLCLSPSHGDTNLKNTSHFLNLPIFIQLCHAQSSASTSTNRADNQQHREQRVYHLSVLLFPPPPLFCKGHLLSKGNPVPEKVWVVE